MLYCREALFREQGVAMDAFISSVITLALVLDAFGNIPLFVTALKKVSPERRLIVLLRELFIALAIMIAFVFMGQWFLRWFGIEAYSLSIAGGILLFLISLDLVFGKPEDTAAKNQDPKKEDEPFVVPLAVPLVAGPGALSMIMILSAQHPNKLMTLGVVLTASLINSAILMSSSWISNVLGKRGLLAIERLTGMILILTSVNMVMGGISEFINL